MKGSCEELSSCIDGVCVEGNLNFSYNFFTFCFQDQIGSGLTSEALLWNNKDFPYEDLF